MAWSAICGMESKSGGIATLTETLIIDYCSNFIYGLTILLRLRFYPHPYLKAEIL